MKGNLYKRGVFSEEQLGGIDRLRNRRAIFSECVPLLMDRGTKYSSGLALARHSPGSLCVDGNILFGGGAWEIFR
jgi:hypothetical protein